MKRYRVCAVAVSALVLCYLLAMGVNAAPIKLTLICMAGTEGDQNYGYYRLPAIESFEQKHPDVTVELINEYGRLERVTILSAAGIGPDVFETANGSGNVLPYVRRGMVLELSRFVERDAKFWDDILAPVRGFAAYEGKIYFVPADYLSAYVLWFRGDMFAEAGLSYPDNDWTLDEFVRKGNAMKRDTDGDGQIDRFMYSISPWNAWKPMFWNLGGRFFSDDYKEQKLDSAGTIGAMEQLQALMYEDRVLPPFREWGNYNRDALFAGRKAITHMGMSGLSWIITQIDPKAVDLGIVLEPIGPQGLRQPMVHGPMYAIGADSKHPQLAWELIKELAGDEAGTQAVENWYCVGVRAKTLTAFYDMGSPGLLNWRETFETVLDYPMRAPHDDQISGIGVNLSPVWSGDQPARGYLERIAESVQAKMDDFWQGP